LPQGALAFSVDQPVALDGYGYSARGRAVGEEHYAGDRSLLLEHQRQVMPSEVAQDHRLLHERRKALGVDGQPYSVL